MRTVPERIYDAALRALTDTNRVLCDCDACLRERALAVTDGVCAELGVHNPRPPRRRTERVDVTGGRV